MSNHNPFATLPVATDHNSQIVVSLGFLLDALRIAPTFASKDDARTPLNQIAIAVEGKVAHVAATDGHRACIFSETYDPAGLVRNDRRIGICVEDVADRAKIKAAITVLKALRKTVRAKMVPVALHVSEDGKEALVVDPQNGDVVARLSTTEETLPPIHAVIPQPKTGNAAIVRVNARYAAEAFTAIGDWHAEEWKAHAADVAAQTDAMKPWVLRQKTSTRESVVVTMPMRQ